MPSLALVLKNFDIWVYWVPINLASTKAIIIYFIFIYFVLLLHFVSLIASFSFRIVCYDFSLLTSEKLLLTDQMKQSYLQNRRSTHTDNFVIKQPFHGQWM